MFEGMVAELMNLDDDALTERFRARELVRRRAVAEMAAITKEAERRALHTVDGHRSVRHWVRAQINCPLGEATRLRRVAIACDQVAGLGDTLLGGHIGAAQADELARLATHPRVGDMFPTAAPLLTGHAEQLSYEEFRLVTRRWETLADLDGADRDDEVSHERRTASVLVFDGALDVTARGGTALAGAEMLGIFDRFVAAEFAADVAARTAEFGPDAPAAMLPRSDAQRRFDALTAIFRAAVTAPADGIAPRPVLNLLVGLGTYERLVERRLTGIDPGLDSGLDAELDLRVERIETTNGVAVSPASLLAASVVAEVRRVVVDSAGVVVDAGRRRRLFTGPAREMALLLAHSCGHLACTVRADHCEVDHVTEWDRDAGRTDQINARPRCSTHNPLKTARGIRSVRTRDGTIVDIRADGTPMAPVGRRLHLDPDDPDGPGDQTDVAVISGYRIVRVEYCRFRRRDAKLTSSDPELAHWDDGVARLPHPARREDRVDDRDDGVGARAGGG